MTCGVKPCETPVGLVPEVTLRPDCKTHHTLLQRRLGATVILIYSRGRSLIKGLPSCYVIPARFRGIIDGTLLFQIQSIKTNGEIYGFAWG